MDIIDNVLGGDPLVQLVQKENFVGWVFGIDYDTARVMTNDLWKAETLGVPHNCFLVASVFEPDRYSETVPEEREVLLLRVVGATKLPQDDDLVRTKIDNFQQHTDPFGQAQNRQLDDITQNQLQFSGLECRVLGTFYTVDGRLKLGSDLESFASASRLNVYRPRGEALNTIVNYIDPIRKKGAEEEARQLGFSGPVRPFPIGSVRYTSTDRLHRGANEPKVPVCIQPSDFLARRTSVLGMTRTGKSNMIKQVVSVVKRVADDGGARIGQIIYDLNGEYANANRQDKGAIADIYPETVRYRMIHTDGFLELQNNFYLQLNEGFAIIRRLLTEGKNDTQVDVSVFLNTSLDEPDQQERSLYNRWQVRSAAYQAMLSRAGFAPPPRHRITFRANQAVRAAIASIEGHDLPDPSKGLTPEQAEEWFLAARKANLASQLTSSSGGAWLDDDTKAILNMMATENEKGTFIRGYNLIKDARKYHSPRRSQEVGEEIYRHLEAGKIVILDLSVGDPYLRDRISQQIAQYIFATSMSRFVEDQVPPNIVVYIEEAHNLIGKDADLTSTWPRLAKEGAKYRIALVYATQEVSSMHPNILANTENWFITHLNNEREIRELARFYDFADFSRSLIRAQDVGFARVKTLSSPFVVPVQIDKFDPDAVKRHQSQAPRAAQGKAQPGLFQG